MVGKLLPTTLPPVMVTVPGVAGTALLFSTGPLAPISRGGVTMTLGLRRPAGVVLVPEG